MYKKIRVLEKEGKEAVLSALNHFLKDQSRNNIFVKEIIERMSKGQGIYATEHEVLVVLKNSGFEVYYRGTLLGPYVLATEAREKLSQK
ncbi:hypothetical protein GYA54_03260 [Candidatus Kuenenbacteria bacterium]|nr:hypothetical protein [Candidatus Kuenenbacteria bacterium]